MTSPLINSVWDPEWATCLPEEDERLRVTYIHNYPDLTPAFEVESEDMDYPLIVVPLVLTRYISVMHIASYRTIADLLRRSNDVVILWLDLVARTDPQVQTRHKPSINRRRSRHEDILKQVLKTERVSDVGLDTVLESKLYRELISEEGILDVYRGFAFDAVVEPRLDLVKGQEWADAQTVELVHTPYNYGSAMQTMQSLLTAFMLLWKRSRTGGGTKGAIMVGLEKMHMISRIIGGFTQLAAEEKYITGGWTPGWAEDILPIPENSNVENWKVEGDNRDGRSYYIETIIDLDEKGGKSQLRDRSLVGLHYHAKCLGCITEVNTMLLGDDGEEDVGDELAKTLIIDILKTHCEQFEYMLTTRNNDRLYFSNMLNPMSNHGLTLLKLIMSDEEENDSYKFEDIQNLVYEAKEAKKKLKDKGEEGGISVGRLSDGETLGEAISNLVECNILEEEHVVKVRTSKRKRTAGRPPHKSSTILQLRGKSWSLRRFDITIR